MASTDNSEENPQQQLRREVVDCANIIRFRYDGQKYHDFNAARADPNQRLVEVFGINNSFTSTDRVVRGEFIRATASKMRAATKMENRQPKGNWDVLRESACAFQEHLEQAEETVDATRLVQFVTLKVVISYLFNSAREVIKDNSFKSIK